MPLGSRIKGLLQGSASPEKELESLLKRLNERDPNLNAIVDVRFSKPVKPSAQDVERLAVACARYGNISKLSFTNFIFSPPTATLVSRILNQLSIHPQSLTFERCDVVPYLSTILGQSSAIHVVRLQIHNCNLGDSGVQSALAPGLQAALPSLRSLSLHSNPISTVGAATILTTLASRPAQFPPISLVDFRGCKLAPDSAARALGAAFVALYTHTAAAAAAAPAPSSVGASELGARGVRVSVGSTLLHEMVAKQPRTTLTTRTLAGDSAAVAALGGSVGVTQDGWLYHTGAPVGRRGSHASAVGGASVHSGVRSIGGAPVAVPTAPHHHHHPPSAAYPSHHAHAHARADQRGTSPVFLPPQRSPRDTNFDGTSLIFGGVEGAGGSAPDPSRGGGGGGEPAIPLPPTIGESFDREEAPPYEQPDEGTLYEEATGDHCRDETHSHAEPLSGPPVPSRRGSRDSGRGRSREHSSGEGEGGGSADEPRRSSRRGSRDDTRERHDNRREEEERGAERDRERDRGREGSRSRRRRSADEGGSGRGDERGGGDASRDGGSARGTVVGSAVEGREGDKGTVVVGLGTAGKPPLGGRRTGSASGSHRGSLVGSFAAGDTVPETPRERAEKASRHLRLDVVGGLGDGAMLPRWVPRTGPFVWVADVRQLHESAVGCYLYTPSGVRAVFHGKGEAVGGGGGSGGVQRCYVGEAAGRLCVSEGVRGAVAAAAEEATGVGVGGHAAAVRVMEGRKDYHGSEVPLVIAHSGDGAVGLVVRSPDDEGDGSGVVDVVVIVPRILEPLEAPIVVSVVHPSSGRVLGTSTASPYPLRGDGGDADAGMSAVLHGLARPSVAAGEGRGGRGGAAAAPQIAVQVPNAIGSTVTLSEPPPPTAPTPEDSWVGGVFVARGAVRLKDVESACGGGDIVPSAVSVVVAVKAAEGEPTVQGWEGEAVVADEGEGVGVDAQPTTAPANRFSAGDFAGAAERAPVSAAAPTSPAAPAVPTSPVGAEAVPTGDDDEGDAAAAAARKRELAAMFGMEEGDVDCAASPRSPSPSGPPRGRGVTQRVVDEAADAVEGAGFEAVGEGEREGGPSHSAPGGDSGRASRRVPDPAFASVGAADVEGILRGRDRFFSDGPPPPIVKGADVLTQERAGVQMAEAGAFAPTSVTQLKRLASAAAHSGGGGGKAAGWATVGGSVRGLGGSPSSKVYGALLQRPSNQRLLTAQLKELQRVERGEDEGAFMMGGGEEESSDGSDVGGDWEVDGGGAAALLRGRGGVDESVRAYTQRMAAAEAAAGVMGRGDRAVGAGGWTAADGGGRSRPYGDPEATLGALRQWDETGGLGAGRYGRHAFPAADAAAALGVRGGGIEGLGECEAFAPARRRGRRRVQPGGEGHGQERDSPSPRGEVTPRITYGADGGRASAIGVLSDGGSGRRHKGGRAGGGLAMTPPPTTPRPGEYAGVTGYRRPSGVGGGDVFGRSTRGRSGEQRGLGGRSLMADAGGLVDGSGSPIPRLNLSAEREEGEGSRRSRSRARAARAAAAPEEHGIVTTTAVIANVGVDEAALREERRAQRRRARRKRRAEERVAAGEAAGSSSGSEANNAALWAPERRAERVINPADIALRQQAAYALPHPTNKVEGRRAFHVPVQEPPPFGGAAAGPSGGPDVRSPLWSPSSAAAGGPPRVSHAPNGTPPGSARSPQWSSRVPEVSPVGVGGSPFAAARADPAVVASGERLVAGVSWVGGRRQAVRKV